MNCSCLFYFSEGVTPYKCRICGEQFRWHTSFKRHKIWHDGKANLVKCRKPSNPHDYTKFKVENSDFSIDSKQLFNLNADQHVANDIESENLSTRIFPPKYETISIDIDLIKPPPRSSMIC